MVVFRGEVGGYGDIRGVVNVEILEFGKYLLTFANVFLTVIACNIRR
jgi:hypothetical protein